MHPPHQRILWVEDNEDNREVVNFFLEQTGFCVTNAGTSVEALSLAQINHFDLYLLGDWFPHGKGSQLCEQLHEFDPRRPILFFSAAAYQTDRQRGMEAGAQAYLTKPSGLDELEQLISRLLDEAWVSPPTKMRSGADQRRKSMPLRLVVLHESGKE